MTNLWWGAIVASGPKAAPPSCEIFASPDVLMSESCIDLTGMHVVAIGPAQVWLISNKPYVLI